MQSRTPSEQVFGFGLLAVLPGPVPRGNARGAHYFLAPDVVERLDMGPRRDGRC